MIRHIAMMRLSPDATPAQVQAIADGLAQLPGLIPQLRDYRVGPDAGFVDGNWDFVAVADFDDRAGWEAYTANEVHQRVIAERIRPILVERAAVQFEI